MNHPINRIHCEHRTAIRPPDVDLAASTLGRLPKTLRKGRRIAKRTWTGFVKGVRCWKGRRVILPDGRIAQVKRVQRGWACVGWEDADSILLHEHRYVEANQLRLHKLAAAVLLGSCKKGVTEIKSER